jgi:hypothetical protein
MKCCGRKPAERLRKSFGAKRTRFRKRAAAKSLREQRTAGNRSRAAAAQKTRLRDPLAVDVHRELQHVTANGIADFYFRARARKLAGVAGVLKMVQDSVAKHQHEYSNARRYFSTWLFVAQRDNRIDA